jgi:hypothetical protein
VCKIPANRACSGDGGNRTHADGPPCSSPLIIAARLVASIAGPSFARSGAGGRRGAWSGYGPAQGRVSGRFGVFWPRAAYYSSTARAIGRQQERYVSEPIYPVDVKPPSFFDRWGQWPATVEPTLREWNRGRTHRLTFVRMSVTFKCPDCDRFCCPHRHGAARLDGEFVCDDCLIQRAASELVTADSSTGSGCSPTGSTSPAGSTAGSARSTSSGRASSAQRFPGVPVYPDVRLVGGDAERPSPSSPAASPARAPAPPGSARDSAIPRPPLAGDGPSRSRASTPIRPRGERGEPPSLSMTEPSGERFSGTWPRRVRR